ncbi:Plasma alpha-L-fucosidase [Cichlidogyrus casuarinus]|uniref:alpha-L-fucosidase n=1 Tax=Cichlidogyrus casuarinus TaxID=1844966 RepID=A0ABD2Q422_9PLAT
MTHLSFLVVTLLSLKVAFGVKYEANWESLDRRPNPEWFDEAKFGIFLHWGVYSVPSFVDEWFWWFWKGIHQKDIVELMSRYYSPNFSYADFAKDFRAEFYDPDKWAEIIEASGAKYAVLTAKHHEGFCLWPSNHSFNWNSMDVGPKRDLVGDFVTAMRARNGNLRVGLYHSLFEWFNPIFLMDKANDYRTRTFVTGKTIPEMRELVTNYRPDIIWSDGDYGPDSYWNATTFLAWLFNDSPVKDSVAINDRWCDPCRNKHGGFFTGQDSYNPGKIEPFKWENCYSIDELSYGYRRNMALKDVRTATFLIHTLIETVAYGGNFLLNVGPTDSGVIAPIFEARLREIGRWLAVNGEAIYSTKPWDTIQRDWTTPSVFYTKGPSKTIYMLITDWPRNAKLYLDGYLLPQTGRLIISKGETRPVKIQQNPNNSSQVVVDLITEDFGLLSPGQLRHAWVVKFQTIMLA